MSRLIIVPVWSFPTAQGLISAVNSGKETFLLDLSQSPKSIIINPKRKGGARLRRGESVYVTNASKIWLVNIKRVFGHVYIARNESHSQSASIPPKAGFDPVRSVRDCSEKSISIRAGVLPINPSVLLDRPTESLE